MKNLEKDIKMCIQEINNYDYKDLNEEHIEEILNSVEELRDLLLNKYYKLREQNRLINTIKKRK